jgi:hypothetical protein
MVPPRFACQRRAGLRSGSPRFKHSLLVPHPAGSGRETETTEAASRKGTRKDRIASVSVSVSLRVRGMIGKEMHEWTRLAVFYIDA